MRSKLLLLAACFVLTAAKSPALPQPEMLPTSDGKTQLLVWKAVPNPTHWIVSLPGTNGTAARDFEVWQPGLKDQPVGYITLQWWLGGENYYRPAEIYRELDIAITKLGLQKETFLLHGFSRGSANIFAVAAMDHANRGYFHNLVASSGGVSVDYPPTARIVRGEFGATPFAGQRWTTACGMKDPNPERDGCPAMRRTAQWITQYGGTVVSQVEDPNYGHGALQLNEANMKSVLEDFLKQ